MSHLSVSHHSSYSTNQTSMFLNILRYLLWSRSACLLSEENTHRLTLKQSNYRLKDKLESISFNYVKQNSLITFKDRMLWNLFFSPIIWKSSVSFVFLMNFSLICIAHLTMDNFLKQLYRNSKIQNINNKTFKYIYIYL